MFVGTLLLVRKWLGNLTIPGDAQNLFGEVARVLLAEAQSSSHLTNHPEIE